MDVFTAEISVRQDLASIVLNEEIAPNRVTQAFRGIPSRRRDLKEAESAGLKTERIGAPSAAPLNIK